MAYILYYMLHIHLTLHIIQNKMVALYRKTGIYNYTLELHKIHITTECYTDKTLKICLINSSTNKTPYKFTNKLANHDHINCPSELEYGCFADRLSASFSTAN